MVINSAGYIATARKLLAGQSSEADIRRAISTAYYALFHHLCWHFSQIVLHPADAEFERASSQTYRHIDHGPAKQRCLEATSAARNFPAEIMSFARTFVELQERRVEADYDPTTTLLHADARELIQLAEKAIAAFNTTPAEAQRAFAVFIGLRPRYR